MVPAVGGSCPLSILKNVLLPAPLGPMRQRSSPRLSRKLTPVTAVTPPKFLERPRVSSSVLPAGTVLAARFWNAPLGAEAWLIAGGSRCLRDREGMWATGRLA